MDVFANQAGSQQGTAIALTQSMITPSVPPQIHGLLERREAAVRAGRLVEAMRETHDWMAAYVVECKRLHAEQRKADIAAFERWQRTARGPVRMLPLALLPGRPVGPGFHALCGRCKRSTPHDGLTDARGRELGAACLCCGRMSKEGKR